MSISAASRDPSSRCDLQVRPDQVEMLASLSQEEFRAVWDGDVETRRFLIRELIERKVDNAATRAIRIILGPILFRAFNTEVNQTWSERDVQWLSNAQLQERLRADSSLTGPDPFSNGYPSYFHPIANFRVFLSSKTLFRNETPGAAYPGVFLATYPPFENGKFVLCFTGIDFVSPVCSVYPANEIDYCPGLQNTFPITREVLVAVIVEDNHIEDLSGEAAIQEIKALKDQFRARKGFDVPFIWRREAQPWLNAIRKIRGIVIPRSWPLRYGRVL